MRLVADEGFALDSNTLRSLSGDNQPRIRLVGPRLDIMEKCISDLDTLVSKLVSYCLDALSVFSDLSLFCSEEAVHEAQLCYGES